jgi:NTE family protein
VTAATWVFGGGGVGGIAWQIGVLAGLHDEGVDIAPECSLLGTSAGAVVAAKVGSGRPVEELYDEQRAGVHYEVAKGLSLRMLLTMTVHGIRSRTAPEFGRRIGRPAVAFGQEEAAVRRRVIEDRLPSHEWADRDVRVVAVDADTGVHRVIAAGQEVPLVDAVMASCAIPLVWPVVPIDGHRYMDGGMRSPVNLDLAPGDGAVVALAPTTRWQRWARLVDQRTALGPNRSALVLTMAKDVRRAQGRNPLNIGTVPAVVEAGRAQGRRDAATVAATLRSTGRA